MPTNPIEQVLKTIRNYDMLKPRDKVMAAVSGGPDSVFLLYALYRLKGKLKMGGLVVSNLNHGLRGEESREDSLFVEKMCQNLGLEYFHKRIDLRIVKSEGLSTEESARDERYKFFRDAARKASADVIATGHTLDDQAETVLMRLVKGSSLKGIVGISPAREDGIFRVIRPLIELEKDQIRDYLNSKGIPYRIDRTNLEPVYFRNVIRQEVIPFLEKYNPRLKRALFNLAEHLREDFEFIKEEKQRAQTGTAGTRDGRLEIKLKDIAVQPRAIQKEILRDSLEKAGGNVKRLSFRHWKEMEGLIRHKRKGSFLDLPGGVRVERTESTLAFYLL